MRRRFFEKVFIIHYFGNIQKQFSQIIETGLKAEVEISGEPLS